MYFTRLSLFICTSQPEVTQEESDRSRAREFQLACDGGCNQPSSLVIGEPGVRVAVSVLQGFVPQLHGAPQSLDSSSEYRASLSFSLHLNPNVNLLPLLLC